MNAPPDSDTHIGYLLHEVAKLFRRRFDEAARVHGLTLPQWRVLKELHQRGPTAQVALAGCTDTDPMTLSGILDRLEKRGLVERSPDPADSRAKLARLTDEGESHFTLARAVGRELYENALAGLAPSDRAALVSGLGHIRNNLVGASAEQKETA